MILFKTVAKQAMRLGAGKVEWVVAVMSSSAIAVELMDTLQRYGHHVTVHHHCRTHRRSATLWSSRCVPLPLAIIVELTDTL
ncbi:unnamed protein product [Sphagnum balticum]